jgi:hypothetical protein
MAFTRFPVWSPRAIRYWMQIDLAHNENVNSMKVPGRFLRPDGCKRCEESKETGQSGKKIFQEKVNWLKMKAHINMMRGLY